MNYSSAALSAVAATIAFFALGYLGEGWLFRSHFQSAAGVYRSADQMQRLMPIGMAVMAVASYALVAVYARWCVGRPDAWSGLQFGVLLGVIVTCVHPIPNLLTMNLGFKLGLEIAAATFVQWLTIGVVFGLTYKPR